MKDEKNYFTSDDLQNTLEVPSVDKNKPASADGIDDPWRLNSDGQPDEVLEFISKKLAEKEKERELARKNSIQIDLSESEKKDNTVVMGSFAGNGDLEVAQEVKASDDTMLIPEVTPEQEVKPVSAVSDDTVVMDKVPVSDDTVIMKKIPAAERPVKVPTTDSTIVVEKVPGADVLGGDTIYPVQRKTETPETKNYFQKPTEEDMGTPKSEEVSDQTMVVQKVADAGAFDPDATQLVHVVEPEETKAPDDQDDDALMERFIFSIEEDDQPAPAEEKVEIERSPAPKGRLWPPVLVSSLVMIVACFITLAIGVMPVLIQNGFARGMTQIISPVLTAGEPKAKTNVLLVGVDKDGYRTDTMMVATYNVDTKQITVMQLPRDTYVPNNGRRDKKLNSAYFTGIDQLKKEVKLSYGMEIHKYVEVDIDAFKKLIDAIGGVEMDVPINMIYDDPTQDLHIYLKKGLQVLDGEKAEQFVRFRKNNDGSGYPRGDLQRMEAQQAFITATVKQIVSGDGLKNINKLIKIALENVNTDMSFNEIYDYCSVVMASEQEIEFMEAPGVARMLSGGSYFIVDYGAAKEIAKTKFYSTEEILDEMNKVAVKAESAPVSAPATEMVPVVPDEPEEKPADTSEGEEEPAEEAPADETAPPAEEAPAAPEAPATPTTPAEPAPAPAPAEPAPAPTPAEPAPAPAPAPEAAAQ